MTNGSKVRKADIARIISFVAQRCLVFGPALAEGCEMRSQRLL